MNRETNFVSAVVYVRNASATVGNFLKKVGTLLDSTFANYEIIVVDDCSHDDSARIVEDVSKLLGGVVSLVRMSFQQGLQLAMNAGVDLAIGDFVYEFDSTVVDYDISLVTEIYFKSLEGFDVVSAAPRRATGAVAKLFYRLYNKNSGSRYPLVTERFRLASRRAINRVQSMSDNVTYRKAFYMRCGLTCRIVEYDANTDAKEKGSAKERRSLAVESLILFTDIAYKMSFFMSCLMMAFAVFGGVYALAVYFSQKPVEGWTTTMLFMSFAFFGVFSILTIIIKYLSVMLDMIFKKQSYSIESVTKLTK
ncbi:MAG: glycosyltransferase [Oscillospiraceae bacterium]